MSNIGYRVFLQVPRPDKALVAEYSKYCTGNITDNMSRFGAMHAAIKPIHRPGLKLVGVAVTVKARIGDNLLTHKALDVAQPGDVIVVDAQGDTTVAIIGEIMCQYARARGLAGFVIDGAVRDSLAIREMDFPVFARGVTPLGPFKNGPGEINVPISCGGLTVRPGDIIVGDDDGVVVIPQKEAKEILEKTRLQAEREAKTIAAYQAGDLSGRQWVDEALQKGGCEIIDAMYT
ncbi:MAG: RraA family protein [Nitrospinota bacterium]|nr:MAG: RraA family protein [Nitrospinota bacterium]